MKSRRLICKPHEALAIRAGTQTQIRRVVKVQPHGSGGWVRQGLEWMFPNICPHTTIKCPYGVVGDHLWLAESWGMAFLHDVPDGHPRKLAGGWGVPAYPWFVPCVVYKADGNFPLATYWYGLFSSPIEMPKEYSRTEVEITAIRVERLQDITDGDAFAEGVSKTAFGCHQHVSGGAGCVSGRDGYTALWNSINGKKYPWESNLWVWVIEFKRLEKSHAI
jgi:hypothetical protein